MINDLVDIYNSGICGEIDEKYHYTLFELPKRQKNAIKVFMGKDGKIESYLFLTDDDWDGHIYFSKDAKNNFPMLNINDKIFKTEKNIVARLPQYIDFLLSGNDCKPYSKIRDILTDYASNFTSSFRSVLEDNDIEIKGCKIQVIFELSDSVSKEKINDKENIYKIVSFLNQQDDDVKVVEDCFGNEGRLLNADDDGTFGRTQVPVLGTVIPFANDRDPKCNKRYGLRGMDTIRITEETRKKVLKTLSGLISKDKLNCQWTTHRDEKGNNYVFVSYIETKIDDSNVKKLVEENEKNILGLTVGKVVKQDKEIDTLSINIEKMAKLIKAIRNVNKTSNLDTRLKTLVFQVDGASATAKKEFDYSINIEELEQKLINWQKASTSAGFKNNQQISMNKLLEIVNMKWPQTCGRGLGEKYDSYKKKFEFKYFDIAEIYKAWLTNDEKIIDKILDVFGRSHYNLILHNASNRNTFSLGRLEGRQKDYFVLSTFIEYLLDVKGIEKKDNDYYNLGVMFRCLDHIHQFYKEDKNIYKLSSDGKRGNGGSYIGNKAIRNMLSDKKLLPKVMKDSIQFINYFLVNYDKDSHAAKMKEKPEGYRSVKDYTFYFNVLKKSSDLIENLDMSKRPSDFDRLMFAIGYDRGF